MAGCDHSLCTQLRDLAVVHATAERIRAAAGRVVADPLSAEAGDVLVPLLLVDAETARAVLVGRGVSETGTDSVGGRFEVGA